MKLNHDEVPHRRLVNVISQARGGAAHASHAPTIQLTNRIVRHLHEIDELSRFIFKVEWNRASDEIKPVGRRRRKEREETLHERYSKIEDTSAPYENR